MLDVAAIVDDKHSNDAMDICHNYQLSLARWHNKDRKVSIIEPMCFIFTNGN